MATKKSTKSTALIPWSEKFAKYAKQGKAQVAAIAGGGPTIKFGPSRINVAGGDVPNATLQCVIVGYCAFNAWYGDDAFDPDDPQPPRCYAYAEVAGPEMAPHAECQDKQADLCADCPKNQFGTASTGKGKACGNNVRLGVLTAKDCEDADGIATAELALAKVSPTNLKAWKGYVDAVTESGRPVWAVVTEIKSKPVTTGRAGHVLEFRKVDDIEDDDVIAALEARFLKVQDTLQQPFGPPIERAKPVKRGGAAPKFAGKKTAGRR
jgi:hypothetical protein